MGHTEMAVSFFEKEWLFDDDRLSSFRVDLLFLTLFEDFLARETFTRVKDTFGENANQ